jgi:hypothetical protein
LIGEYEVQATKAGFQTVVRRGVTLTVGSQPWSISSPPTGIHRDPREFRPNPTWCPDAI